MITTPRTVIRAIGITLAITVGVVFSSARASASCGDYVHIAGQPADQAITLPAPHDRDGLPRPPCHGPNCSNHSPEPVPPFTAPVVESLGAKGLVARSHADDRAGGSSAHSIPRSIGSPVHLPSAIFDPPRAA